MNNMIQTLADQAADYAASHNATATGWHADGLGLWAHLTETLLGGDVATWEENAPTGEVREWDSSHPEDLPKWVPGFVRASYEAEVNPLPHLRKVFPDSRWEYRDEGADGRYVSHVADTGHSQRIYL